MFSTKNIALFTLLALFGSNCSSLKNLASIEQPNLSVTDVKISSISLENIELTFDVSVDNPNAVSINLASYNYNFKINDNSFVKGQQPLSTQIKSVSSSTIQIPVSFGFKELYYTFDSIRDKDETGYNLDATIGVNLPVLGFTEIPIEKSGLFPVVKAPRISASRLTVKNLSFSKADLELQLDIINPNAFGIKLSDLDYAIDINGLRSISGTSSTPIEIISKDTGSITIPVSINLLELGRTAYQILSNDDSIEYSLSGSTNIDASLQFFNPSIHTFNKSGSLNIFN